MLCCHYRLANLTSIGLNELPAWIGTHHEHVFTVSPQGVHRLDAAVLHGGRCRTDRGISRPKQPDFRSRCACARKRAAWSAREQSSNLE
jgi:hypothetical protein